MHHLTMGMCSEKNIIRWFCHCEIITGYAYKNLNGPAFSHLGYVMYVYMWYSLLLWRPGWTKQYQIKTKTRENGAVKIWNKHKIYQAAEGVVNDTALQ
jgi:hypothetical protein